MTGSGKDEHEGTQMESSRRVSMQDVCLCDSNHFELNQKKDYSEEEQLQASKPVCIHHMTQRGVTSQVQDQHDP